MKVDDFLQKSKDTLESIGVASAKLDSLILLEDELGRDRTWILAHPEEEITATHLKNLNKKVARRAKHEPLAYIRGFTEFYGRKFIVNKNVLEPRPESETMIDMLKSLLHHNFLISKEAPWKIADVGTGSGALGITAKLEMPDAKVIATDIDPKCLKVARQNAKKHVANIKFLQGDLLQPLLGTGDWGLGTVALLCNLPYVPQDWKINEAAAMEPRIAIFGGPDGLDIYTRLFEQLKHLNWQLIVFTESLPPQHKALTKVAKSAGFKLVKTQDFIQVFKPF